MSAAGIRSETSGPAAPLPISDFRLRFSEADLSRIWQDQTFPSEALITTEGERLRVVYRGRRTGGPGPDFRDALIAAPGELLRGDVELHVRSSDFRRHGHDRDAAYASVVLHLVFRDDDRCTTLLPGGGQAPVVALEGWVEGRALEIQRWLSASGGWREPCFSSVTRLGGGAVAATLDRLGDMRFRARAADFARRPAAEQPDESLWRALIEGLGYGGERAACKALAESLSWAALRQVMIDAPLAGRRAAAYQRLTAAAAGLPTLRERAMRPANRLEHRLRGGAVLAARLAEKGPVDHFRTLLDAAGETKSPTPLIAALTVSPHIGRSRAIELLANAVLPCLAALATEAISREAEALFGRLPLPARYGAVRHLHEAAGSEVRVGSRRQQGMLYLLKQYCTQGGCGRCPLS